MLTFQNVVDWVAVLPGRGEDGKDILSDFELLIWGFSLIFIAAESYEDL